MMQQPPYGQQRPQPTQHQRPGDMTLMAIVFVGAAIGGFFVWPLIRPAFIADSRPAYQDARGYAPQASQDGYRGRARQ